MTTAPPGAEVFVDGRPTECSDEQCQLPLRPGRHVIKATRLGYLPRVVSLQLDGSAERQLALDSAPAEEQKRQVADALSRGLSPDRKDVAATLTNGFSARVAVVAWQEEQQVRLALFDRALDQIVARQSCPPTAAALHLAGHALVTEWRGEVEPRPLVRRPAFWLVLSAVTALVATAVGLGVWAANRPVRTVHTLYVAEDGRFDTP